MKQVERAALTRLINEFGAEITTVLKPHQPQPRALIGVRRFHLANTDVEWPGDSYMQPSRVSVVVAADISRQQVSMLKNTFDHAGLSIRDDCTLIKSSTANRVMELLVAADSPSLLLVGGEAVTLWRTDVQLRQVVGGLYPARLAGVTRLTGVVESPGAVLRGSVDAKQWRGRVAGFIAAVIDAGEDIDKLTWRCSWWEKSREERCREEAWTWDRLGLPWCRGHMAAGWDAGVRQETLGAKRRNGELQEQML